MADYPTKKMLKQIEKWDANDLKGLMEFISDYWSQYGSFHTVVEEAKNSGGTLKYRLATGGWSGNEEIIAALHSNHIFWMTWWHSSNRGGLYWFGPISAFQE